MFGRLRACSSSVVKIAAPVASAAWMMRRWLAAFPGQVEFETAIIDAVVFVSGKRYTLLDQPLDGFAAVLDGKAHSLFVAQTTTGIECIFDMRLHGVGVIEYGGDPTLGPEVEPLARSPLLSTAMRRWPGGSVPG